MYVHMHIHKEFLIIFYTHTHARTYIPFGTSCIFLHYNFSNSPVVKYYTLSTYTYIYIYNVYYIIILYTVHINIYIRSMIATGM